MRVAVERELDVRVAVEAAARVQGGARRAALDRGGARRAVRGELGVRLEIGFEMGLDVRTGGAATCKSGATATSRTCRRRGASTRARLMSDVKKQRRSARRTCERDSRQAVRGGGEDEENGRGGRARGRRNDEEEKNAERERVRGRWRERAAAAMNFDAPDAVDVKPSEALEKKKRRARWTRVWTKEQRRADRRDGKEAKRGQRRKEGRTRKSDNQKI